MKNANIEHKYLTADSETQEGIVRQIQVAVVSIQGVRKAPIFQDQLTRNWNHTHPSVKKKLFHVLHKK